MRRPPCWPAWWTWRCGETLHAPPVSPGPSGRSGCCLWRTPVPGPAGHTDLGWSFPTEISVQSSLTFLLHEFITCDRKVTVSIATVAVRVPCVSTLVTFHIQRITISSRSEKDLRFPLCFHTHSVCKGAFSHLSVGEQLGQPSLARAETTYSRAKPSNPARNPLPSAWSLLKLNSALKIKASEPELDFVLFLLNVEQSNLRRESATCIHLLLPPGFNSADARNSQVSSGGDELINGILTRKPLARRGRGNSPLSTDGCSAVPSGLLLYPWRQYDHVNCQCRTGGKWTPIHVIFLVQCCSFFFFFYNMPVKYANMHIFIN